MFVNFQCNELEGRRPFGCRSPSPSWCNSHSRFPIQHSHFQIIIQSPSHSHPVNIHLISALWHQCSLLLLDQPVHHDGPERDFCQIRNHRDWICHGPHDSCIHPTHGQVVDEHHSEMWRLINPYPWRSGRRTLHLYGLGGMFIFSIFITISFLVKVFILNIPSFICVFRSQVDVVAPVKLLHF